VNRSLRVTVIAALAAVSGIVTACTIRGPRRPNVVVILIDTLRADHLPFYGYHEDTAPFLARLAAHSVVFDNAWSTSSWTAPATASLFTSMYPFQHGVHTGIMATKWLQRDDATIQINRIPAPITTLPEMLKAAGYRTFGVADNPNICPQEGFDQGFDRFVNFKDETADRVNAVVTDWEREIKSSGPYFLYLHYMDPHAPYHPRDPEIARMPRARRNVAAYDSEIRFVDARVERLFEHMGWERNTILIVLADHGEEFGDHGVTGHGTNLYRETLRIPLLIHFPDGAVEPGRVAANVSIIDVIPTIRSLLGLAAGATDEGKDLLRLRRGGALVDRPVYAHLWRRGVSVTDEDDKISRAVMRGPWKYVLTLPDREELYNLAEDPRETANLMARQGHIGEELRKGYDALVETSRTHESQDSPIRIDAEALRKLQALGYAP
jgi:arylsulfatase A-like enzyme